MKNSIRWLLTETKVSSLKTQQVNFIDGKLICYHLTSHDKWAHYNKRVNDKLNNPRFEGPEQELSSDDSRAASIVKNLKNKNRITTRDTYEIEEDVILDMISDPYTDTSGFKAGGGDFHGKGLYTCFKFNPRIASVYGDICLAFEIDISNFLIFFEDLARQVHGDNFSIKSQLIKLYNRKNRSRESIDKFIEVIDSAGVDKMSIDKSIHSKNYNRSAGYSQDLLEALGDPYMKSVYDGIIIYGGNDGPVCVSYYPEYDARLIGLGRLSSATANATVDWYDSLNDFVGGRARMKLDFETMNQAADENTSEIEKQELKERERPLFDYDYMNIITTLQKMTPRINSPSAAEELSNLYNELLNMKDNKEVLTFFYENIATGNYTSNTSSLANCSSEDVANNARILEDTYEYFDKKGETKKVEGMLNFFVNQLSVFSGVVFSEKFLLEGVLAHARRFFHKDHFEKSPYTGEAFIKSALKYIDSTEVSEKFSNDVRELDSHFGLLARLMSADWDEIIKIYEEGDQSVKEIIYNLPISTINRNPFHETVWDSDVGRHVKNKAIEDKKLIDTFCEIVEVMIRKNNLPIAQFMRDAFESVKFKFSDIVINKVIQDILEMSDSNDRKVALAAAVSGHIKKFGANNIPLLEELDVLLNQIKQKIGKHFDKKIKKLEQNKATNATINYNEMNTPDSKYYHYYTMQSSEWRKNIIRLYFQNIDQNPKFQKLNFNSIAVILWTLELDNTVLSPADYEKLIVASGKLLFYVLQIPNMDLRVYSKFAKNALMNNLKGNFQSSLPFSKNFFKFIYQDRSLLDTFIEKSSNKTFNQVINYIIEALKGNSRAKLNSAYCYWTKEPKEPISNLIDLSDTQWLNYLVESIRTKTNEGKTKKAEAVFRELESLVAAKDVSQDADPQLDLSHRKIFGNTLREVYSF